MSGVPVAAAGPQLPPLYLNLSNVVPWMRKANLSHQDLHKLLSALLLTPSSSSLNFSNMDPASSSDSSDETFAFVVEGVLLSIISGFGVIGTLMSIIVLRKPALRESFSLLLTSLAVSDILFLCFSVLVFGLPKLAPGFHEAVGKHILPLSYGFLCTWRSLSTFLTVSLTFERYTAIVKPLSGLKSSRWFRYGLLVFSVVVATAYNVPRFFEMEKLQLENGQMMVVASPIRKNPAYIKYYMLWSKLLLLDVFPFLTLVTLNILILNKVYKSTIFRKRFQSSTKSSRRYSYNNTMSILVTKEDTPKQSRINSRINLDDISMRGIELGRLTPEPQKLFGDRRWSSTSFSSRRPSAAPSTIRSRSRSPSPINIKHRRGSSLRSVHHYSATASAQVPPTKSLSMQIDVKVNIREAEHDEIAPIRKSRTPSPHMLMRVQGPSGCSTLGQGLVTPCRTRSPSPRRRGLVKDPSRVSLCVTRAESTMAVNNDPRFRRRRSLNFKLGKTLLSVSLLYLGCHSLKLIPDLYEFFWCPESDPSEDEEIECETNGVIEALITTSNLLMCINSAANFLMYMLKGAKFRRAFLQTYSRKEIESQI